MFDMSTQQQQAFSDATTGVSALTFNHLVLFLIGLLATIWLLMIFLGLWKELRQQKIDMGELIGKFSFAVLIIIAVGSMIFY